MSARVLVVDDDAAMAELCADIVRDQGHEPTTVTDASSVMSLVEAGSFDLVITDVRMAGVDGIELVARLHAFDPRIATVAMTAFGSIETAVRAIRSGATDYVAKPFEPSEMGLRIERALDRRAMALELTRLRSQVGGHGAVKGMVGRSRALEDIASLVKRVADTPSTVLVSGPSGSGKELVARALHAESRRNKQPFVAINCAAIPETLLEAELFGVRKGAYTDARADRPGVFVEAASGTLFLDEIGELAPLMQAKLLRALQEREIRPIGGTSAVPVDARVVAATNRDLRGAIAQKEFREDLFYRLAVIEITVPALRDRPDDVLPLAEHFLALAAARAGKPIAGFSAAASKQLLAYHWPGNVRELENAVERAVALCEADRISPDDLPQATTAQSPADFLEAAAERQMTIEQLDRAYAALVLRRNGGNKQRAASVLGVDRRTLQRWFGEPADAPDSRASR